MNNGLKIRLKVGKRKSPPDEGEVENDWKHPPSTTTQLHPESPSFSGYLFESNSNELSSDLYNDLDSVLDASQELTVLPAPNGQYEEGEYEDDELPSPQFIADDDEDPFSGHFDALNYDAGISTLLTDQSGKEQPRSSSSASAASFTDVPLLNEPASVGDGVSLGAGRVYHDSMYSSDDEISNAAEPADRRPSAMSFTNDGDEQADQDSEGDAEFDDDEVDAMLEESDGYGRKTDKEKSEKAPLMMTIEKHILVEKGNHYFEFLPNGWLKVIHQSGMPVYFHRETRICTLSRPYGLGKTSLRGHKIPISAIPCLEYRRANEEGKPASEPAEGSACPVGQGNPTASAAFDDDAHTTTLYTADDHVQKSLLTAVAVRDYCSKLFEFKSRTVHRYSNWKIGRGQIRIAKKMRAQEHAMAGQQASTSNGDAQRDTPNTMVKSAKIITITRPSLDGKSQVTFNMNPTNKTSVSILCEYLQHARKVQPVYKFIELPDSNTPYQAVLEVDGKKEGQGLGASKKLAKAEAAKNAILTLAPELKVVFEAGNTANKDYDIFDDIVIDDHRVAEIAHKSSHPAPYQLLVNALSRLDAHGASPRPDFTSEKKGHLKNKYTMTAGQHTVSFVHQLHHFAKHMCAQMILKAMHPELKYYGDLLKLYGRRLEREKVKKREDQRAITDLQTKGKWGEPNWELLDKLKEVMRTVIPVPLQPGEISRIRY